MRSIANKIRIYGSGDLEAGRKGRVRIRHLRHGRGRLYDEVLGKGEDSLSREDNQRLKSPLMPGDDSDSSPSYTTISSLKQTKKDCISKSRIHDLETELQFYTEECARLRLQAAHPPSVSVSEEEFKQLQNENERLKKEAIEATSAKRKKKRKSKSGEFSLSAEVQRLKMCLEQANEAKTALENDLKSRDSDIHRLMSDLQSAHDSLSTHESSLATSLKERQEAAKTLESQLQSVRKALSSATRTVKDLEQANKHLEEQANALSISAGEREVEVQRLRMELNKGEKAWGEERERWEREMERVRGDVASAGKKRNEEGDGKIREIGKLKAEIDLLIIEKKEMTEKIKQFEAQLAANDKKIRQIDRLHSEIADFMAKTDSLTQELAVSKGQSQSDQQTISELRSQIAQKAVNLTEMIDILTKSAGKDIAILRKHALKQCATISEFVSTLTPRRNHPLSVSDMSELLNTPQISQISRDVICVLAMEKDCVSPERLIRLLEDCREAISEPETPAIAAPGLNFSFHPSQHTSELPESHPTPAQFPAKPLNASTPTVPHLIDTGPDSPTYAFRLLTLLQHVALRLQMARFTPQSLAERLTGYDSDIPADYLLGQLALPPLAISDPQDRQLFLLMCLDKPLCEGNMASVPWDCISVASGRLREILKERLGQWDVYPPDEESSIDTSISSAMIPVSDQFRLQCASLDPDHSGYITSSQFFTILSGLKVSFSERAKGYLRLLFYSLDHHLDHVPYETFLGAYVAPQPPTPPHRTEIVLELIARMAKSLGRRRVRDVFAANVEGVVSEAHLRAGMTALGMWDVGREVLEIVMEELQYQGSDQRCVSLAELEEMIAREKGEGERESIGGSSVFSESQERMSVE